MSESQADNLKLAELAATLVEWRSTHKAPSRIPGEVWSGAASLASTLGVCRVSRELKLGYAALKRRTNGSALPNAPTTTAASFVEWLPAFASNSNISECSLEADSSKGTKVRLRMSNVPAPSIGAMLRELLA